MAGLSDHTRKHIDHLKAPMKLDEATELRSVFDPVLRCFSVQLWKHSSPTDLLGMVDQFTHADDVLDAIDGFLVEHGERPLTEDQMGHLGGALIAAKGGPDLALLAMALEEPKGFFPLD